MLTRSDGASLTSVRTTLNQSSGITSLNQLYDRRAIIADLSHEPLYLTLNGVLVLGAATALFLALLGTLLTSWLSARRRLTSFAVLRALGARPRQIASVLTWEQLIIYTTAIVLGIFFGLIFSLVVIPALAFTSVPPAGIIGDISSQAFFALQNTPQVEIVFPTSLWIALGLLVAICAIALGMMVRIVSRPSISQTLRLNED
jgi:ABC-type antimicrobial peptide transport system permease subunit